MIKTKYLLIHSVAAAGLLITPLAASARVAPQERPYPQDRDRDRWDEMDRFQDRVFSRLRADLDRAFAYAAPMEGDRGRLERARDRLNLCQRMVRDRNVDRRAFDEAVGSVEEVLSQNRIPDDTRADLRYDVRELRRLQDRLQ
jgi:hypothetical protein